MNATMPSSLLTVFERTLRNCAVRKHKGLALINKADLAGKDNCTGLLKLGSNTKQREVTRESKGQQLTKQKDKVKNESCYLSIPGQTTQIHLPIPIQEQKSLQGRVDQDQDQDRG